MGQPVVQAAADGIHHFHTAIADDPIADALYVLLVWGSPGPDRSSHERTLIKFQDLAGAIA